MQTATIYRGKGGAHCTVLVRGADFLRTTKRKTATMLGVGASVATVEYRRALGKSNRQGNSPSLPGQVPKKGTGAGLRALRSTTDRLEPAAYVLLGKEGAHLLMLDQGTRPHPIRAKRGKMLMIPWRGKGTIGGTPTRATIAHYGLKKVRGQWVMFRPEVRHPGTLPRPWRLPVLQTAMPKIARAMAAAAR